MNKHFNYIVIGLLVLVFLQGFFHSPEGITENEHRLMLKIHDQSQEIILQKKLRNQDKLKIKLFKDEIIKIKNSPVIDTASIGELNNMLTDYLDSRR